MKAFRPLATVCSIYRTRCGKWSKTVTDGKKTARYVQLIANVVNRSGGEIDKDGILQMCSAAILVAEQGKKKRARHVRLMKQGKRSEIDLCKNCDIGLR